MGVMDVIMGGCKMPEQTEAQVRASRAMDELVDLPQFARVTAMGTRIATTRLPRDGILNMLNGCLVSEGENGLRLTWQLDSYETPGHSALLSDVASIEKFVSLMIGQAAVQTR